MDFLRKVNSLIQKRENLHPDDPAIQFIWHDLVNLLKSNEESAIALLEQSKETELYWLCEILDMKQDIEYAIQSIEE